MDMRILPETLSFVKLQDLEHVPVGALEGEEVGQFDAKISFTVRYEGQVPESWGYRDLNRAVQEFADAQLSKLEELAAPYVSSTLEYMGYGQEEEILRGFLWDEQVDYLVSEEESGLLSFHVDLVLDIGER